jgi:hypothetical protein
MRELPGDLWEIPDVDARGITTNGDVAGPDRHAVMGRGVALQACQRWPGLDLELGRQLEQWGNHVLLLRRPDQPTLFSTDGDDPAVLYTFPVKHHWRDRASLELIRRSAHELVELADEEGWEAVALPRPGCGNGHLSWERTVKGVLAPLLDDRFLIVYDGSGP